MRSIRTQFIVFALSGIALAVLIVGGISLRAAMVQSNNAATEIVNLMVQNEAQRLDNIIDDLPDPYDYNAVMPAILPELEAMHPYSAGGYAFLCSADGIMYYHPSIPTGTDLFNDDDDLSVLDMAIIEGSNGNSLIPYDYHGDTKQMAIYSLKNGLRLTLCVSDSDVYAQRNQLAATIVLATLAILALFTLLSVTIIRRTLRPLADLTNAARKVAAGDLDVEILNSQTTELRDLIESYQVTVKNLKEQMATIDDMAHRDGMTGLFNKSAFEEAATKLDTAIAEGRAHFALVMADVNDLKPVNDTYGHERGDEYLLLAARTMKQCFAGMPVYRFGGDELVVILEGDATARLQHCCDALARTIEQTSTNEHPWQRVNLAWGTATYDPACDTTTAHVFDRADTAMYATKRRMKRGA